MQFVLLLLHAQRQCPDRVQPFGLGHVVTFLHFGDAILLRQNFLLQSVDGVRTCLSLSGRIRRGSSGWSLAIQGGLPGGVRFVNALLLLVDARLQSSDGIQSLCLGFRQSLQGGIQPGFGGFPFALQTLGTVRVAFIGGGQGHIRCRSRCLGGLGGFFRRRDVFGQRFQFVLSFGQRCFQYRYFISLCLIGAGRFQFFFGFGNGALGGVQLLLQLVQIRAGADGRRCSSGVGDGGFFCLCFGCGFRAGLTFGFFFGGFAFLPRQAFFKAQTGALGFGFGGTVFADGTFGVAVILHQRNMAWAHV